MATIYGFLRTSDPGRLSSISTSKPGTPKGERKFRKLRTAMGGSPYLVVDSCSSHTQGDPVIPVELRQWNGSEWCSLGKAGCCPLCWAVVRTPEGIELPPPLPDATAMAPWIVSKLPRKHEAAKTTSRAGTRADPVMARGLRWLEKVDASSPFTLVEMIDGAGISRASAIALIKKWLVIGTIELVQAGGGRGKRALYQKKVLKKGI